MIKEAIILAGGFGTRLQSLVSDVPKPMAPVNDRPFLDYQLRYLKHFGIGRVILSVGYLHEKITGNYGAQFERMELDYSIEKEALGTGGGIRLSMEKAKDDTVLVLNGDSFFDCDLHSFSDLHKQSGADGSLALRKVSNASRYGAVHLTPFPDNTIRFESLAEDVRLFGKIIGFAEKHHLQQPGLINAGIYLLNRRIYLENTASGKNFSIEKDFFEKKLAELNICGFEFKDYFIDIGVPEDYTKAQDDFKGFKY